MIYLMNLSYDFFFSIWFLCIVWDQLHYHHASYCPSSGLSMTTLPFHSCRYTITLIFSAKLGTTSSLSWMSMSYISVLYSVATKKIYLRASFICWACISQPFSTMTCTSWIRNVVNSPFSNHVYRSPWLSLRTTVTRLKGKISNFPVVVSTVKMWRWPECGLHWKSICYMSVGTKTICKDRESQD